MDVTEVNSDPPLSNAIVQYPDVSEIEDNHWQAVSSRYPLALRLTIAVYATFFLLVPWIAYAVIPYFPWQLVLVENSAAAMVLGFLAFVWVPRRARHTKYLLRELDVNLQMGCWWHSSTSVAINRVQHLEVTQGPIERALNLSKLHVFTAGGARSDMVIPGLDVKVAQQLKTHLLAQVGNEQLEDELL